VVLLASGDAWSLSARDLLDKNKRMQIERRLAGETILIDVRLGGLRAGLLADDSDQASDVTAQRWEETGQPVVPIRIRRTADPRDASDAEWRQEVRIAFAYSDDGDEVEWLVVDSLVRAPAESEEGRSVTARRDQKLDEHEVWTERAAHRLASRLDLLPRYSEMLALAARLHDEGKRAKRWQQAFHAPGDAVYAKTRSRPNIHLLAGYRHELGSLPRAERDPRVQALDDDLRDLCLHLIAAHHGHARPLLRTDGAEEPPSKMEARAQEIALRFTRLEKRWGPWGLAWWEALLRAADQQASRENDERTGDD
jgi:CRISPR-associated endonuclease/helicase Cas3